VDDWCICIIFVRNMSVGVYDMVVRMEVVAKVCVSAVSRPVDVISDVCFYFDGFVMFGVVSTKGDVIFSECVVFYSGGVVIY